MAPYNPRITFTVDVGDPSETTYDLGQMSHFSPSYEGNVLIRNIPRAKGVQIYSGEEMGGGTIHITVHAFKILSTRLAIEQYLLTLINNIANKKGTLTIESTLTMTNCSIRTLNPDADHQNWNRFTVEFVKSL